VEELVASFVDVVSKNGNLLLNVGPRADGSLPQAQRVRLEGLGRWLEINGEAIFGSRPWRQAAAETVGGGRVRFTCKGDTVYLIVLDVAAKERVAIAGVSFEELVSVKALAGDRSVDFVLEEGRLSFELPPAVNEGEARVFKLIPKK